MAHFTIAVLVKNQFGVLNRVTSMFRRRRFNIQSLTVSETESADFSRITLSSSGEDAEKKQLIEQLYKLTDVVSIKELTSENAINNELLLIKMKNEPDSRRDILAAVDAYRGKTVDYTRESMVIQIVGNNHTIDSFIDLMRDYEILELCRTGIVALERGKTTLSEGVQA